MIIQYKNEIENSLPRNEIYPEASNSNYELVSLPRKINYEKNKIYYR